MKPLLEGLHHHLGMPLEDELAKLSQVTTETLDSHQAMGITGVVANTAVLAARLVLANPKFCEA